VSCIVAIHLLGATPINVHSFVRILTNGRYLKQYLTCWFFFVVPVVVFVRCCWRRRFGISGIGSSSSFTADLRLRGTKPDCFGRAACDVVDVESTEGRLDESLPRLSLTLPRFDRLAATSATDGPVRSTPTSLSAEYLENLSRFTRSRPDSRSISSLSTYAVNQPINQLTESPLPSSFVVVNA